MTQVLAAPAVGNPALNITMFAAFVVLTLAVVIVVGRRKSTQASDFYTGGEQFTGMPTITSATAGAS